MIMKPLPLWRSQPVHGQTETPQTSPHLADRIQPDLRKDYGARTESNATHPGPVEFDRRI